MPTPLYILDDDFKSITIMPQNPERAVHVVAELIKDKIIIPSDFNRAHIAYPGDVAPLEIVATGANKKYTRIFVLCGLVAKHNYVTFKDKIGTDIIYNVNCTLQILDLLGFKYNGKVKSILRDEKVLCDNHGLYDALLVSGEYFTYKKNGQENRVDLKG